MSKTQNDFDPNELIKASESHEKSLAELQKSIFNIEKRVGSDAALAKSFKTAFENDKKMDAVLTNLICQLIVKDDGLKLAIATAVGNIDRKWWNTAWKRGITAIGAILLALLSGSAGYVIRGS